MRELSSKQQCYNFLDRGQGRWRRGQIRSGKYWILSQREGKRFQDFPGLPGLYKEISTEAPKENLCVKHQAKRPRNEGDLAINAKMQRAWPVKRVWVLDDTSSQRLQCILEPCLAHVGSLPGEDFVLPMDKHGRKESYIGFYQELDSSNTVLMSVQGK